MAQDKQYLYYRFYFNKLYLKYYNHKYNKYYNEVIKNIPYHFFIKHPHGEYNYKDNKLKKINYFNIKEYNDKLKMFKGYEVYHDYHPAYKYMIDEFSDMKSDFTKIRHCTYDIETPYIKNINDSTNYDAPINSIAIYSSVYKKSFVLGLKYSKAKNHIHCRTEEELLTKFAKIYKIHDVSAGFNNEAFDMRYIVERMIILFGKYGDKILSPFNQPHKTKYVMGEYGDYEKYEVVGVTDIDVKILIKMYYEKLHKYDLQTASEMILGKSKIHHSESFIEMYEDNYEKHVLYNDVDTLNTNEILEYLQYIPKLFDLSYRSKYIVTHSSDTTASYDVLILNHKRDDINFIGKNKPKRETLQEGFSRGFMGGFVQDPIVGLSGWGFSRDANALYSTTEQVFNISFDSKVDKEDVPAELMEWLYSHSEPFNVYDTYTNSSAKTVKFRDVIQAYRKEYPDIEKQFPKEYFNILYRTPKDIFYKEILFATVGKIIDMDLTEFTPLLIKHNLVMTPNIIFYDFIKEGLYPQMMRIFYADRVNLKHERGKYIKQSTEGERRLYLLFDSGQSTMKLFMNRGYGAIGTETFRWYDIDVANSVTSGGQISTRAVLKAINITLQKYMGDEKNRTSYGDTDSGYIDVDDVVQKEMSHLSDDVEIAEEILKFSERILDDVVEEAFLNIANKLNARVKDIFRMKIEKVYRSAIFFRRKRNVLDKIYDEGKIFPNGKISPTGIKIVEVAYSKIIRNIMETAVQLIMARDYKKFKEWYDKMKYTQFKMLDFDDLAINKSINKTAKYIKPFTPQMKRYKQLLIKEGRYFEGSNYYVEKRTLPALRGASLHNLLIDKGIVKNTHRISDGAKVKMIYLKPSKTREPVYCYTTPEGKDILTTRMIDYNKMFDVTVGRTIQTFLETAKWSI